MERLLDKNSEKETDADSVSTRETPKNSGTSIIPTTERRKHIPIAMELTLEEENRPETSEDQKVFDLTDSPTTAGELLMNVNMQPTCV